MSMTINNEEDFFIKEFTKRTLDNYNEYCGNFEVTQLINSFIGLLVVPKENFFNSRHIPENIIDAEILACIQSSITLNLIDGKPNSDISLHSIIRHMRNAVAHGRMTIKGDNSPSDSQSIVFNEIEFRDSGSYKDKTTNIDHKTNFKISIKLELLKKFIIEFANTILSEGKEK